MITIMLLTIAVSTLRPASCLLSSTSIVFSRHRCHSSSFAKIHNSINNNELWYPPSLMDDMLHRIKAVNSVPYQVQQSLLDFTANGRVLGVVTPKVAQRLTSVSNGDIEVDPNGTGCPLGATFLTGDVELDGVPSERLCEVAGDYPWPKVNGVQGVEVFYLFAPQTQPLQDPAG